MPTATPAVWFKRNALVCSACLLLLLTGAACRSDGASDTLPKNGYRLVPALQAAQFEGRTVGFSTIPGAEDQAVVLIQQGTIWQVPLAGERPPTLFGDLSDRLSPDVLRKDILVEEGLLGLAFSPNFQVDERVYVYYSATEPRRGVLSRFRVIDGVLDTTSEDVLIEVPQPSGKHNGGQLAFGPDGYLYLGVGDGSSGGDEEGNSQNLSTLRGSIIRLDVSGEGYRVPADNPFVDRPDARPEIYAFGLRNPWRFSFDRATGDLWAGDVGHDRWEEINRIVSGGNYGWNITEGFECFDSSGCDTSEFEPPRAVYGHDEGCSVTGGYVYRGPSMPELNGWYVYADFCSGRIWAVNTADAGAPVLLAETGEVITTFGELPNGELLVLAAERAIFRLERAPQD